MAPHIIRHTIAMLLVLTAANLAASFFALHSVRALTDELHARQMRVDAAVRTFQQFTVCVEQQRAVGGDARVCLPH
jgi:hypothetical protein